MNLKVIGMGVLVGALSIYIGTMQADKMELEQALTQAHSKISSVEAQLAVANANVAMTDAVIDRQNMLIAALEGKLSTARTLAEAQLKDISHLSNEKRSAVKEMPAKETLNAIEQHLTEFYNG